mmetsp:Transcript_34095/g.102825  ORF Transcript_34095/g.102825 Transcript_34095/m.102825 type:complete len:284 (-) Transcript_34095:1661-2512(-)
MEHQPPQAALAGREQQQLRAVHARGLHGADAALQFLLASGPSLLPQQQLCLGGDVGHGGVPGRRGARLHAQVHNPEAARRVLQQPRLRAPLTSHHVLLGPGDVAPPADRLARPRRGEELLPVEGHGRAVDVRGEEEVCGTRVGRENDLHVGQRPARVFTDAGSERLRRPQHGGRDQLCSHVLWPRNYDLRLKVPSAAQARACGLALQDLCHLRGVALSPVDFDDQVPHAQPLVRVLLVPSGHGTLHGRDGKCPVHGGVGHHRDACVASVELELPIQVDGEVAC